MGMHGNTPGYAIWVKGSLRMLQSLVISESWLYLTKQAWKGIINCVCVFPERLSSLWQGQCVMFPVALNESSMPVQMASTFSLMWTLENVYPSNRQLNNGQFQAIVMWMSILGIYLQIAFIYIVSLLNKSAYWKKAWKHARSPWNLHQAGPLEQKKVFLSLLAIDPKIKSYNFNSLQTTTEK